eukprot:CAMPEP_0174851924 /NCGR_PEP_ID=MMETSP1114-20130205/24541_1 /TAXON_ID=312471 /ORGANISM="Neobodo designis, Strain CCAP 1951/1" /LENGTH=164 /DNA_ID=CAMNT_0016086491 /DNA_START=200 /DNA_END=695 /DNA_ORIENTATION=-
MAGQEFNELKLEVLQQLKRTVTVLAEKEHSNEHVGLPNDLVEHLAEGDRELAEVAHEFLVFSQLQVPLGVDDARVVEEQLCFARHLQPHSGGAVVVTHHDEFKLQAFENAIVAISRPQLHRDFAVVHDVPAVGNRRVHFLDEAELSLKGLQQRGPVRSVAHRAQ